jgi:DNA-binding NtrC family response regulator
VTRALVVSDDKAAADAVRRALDDTAVEVASSLPDPPPPDGGAGLDFAFVDAELLLAGSRSKDHRTGLRMLRELCPGARVVVMAASEGMREAVEYVRSGAADYLSYPIIPEEVRLVRDNIERREQIRSELSSLPTSAQSLDQAVPLRTRSDAMKAALHKVQQVAPTRSTVLLTGETGTGKSLLAKVIHSHSSRARQQLISVHCGAIPDTLLESELFGHERGAFTGADRRRLGKFEVAHGGTLFLDEIATITPAMQVKLLQVLQDRTIQRLGADKAVEVDVRILAATNMDLGRLTERGEFRNDLYYRLNVFPIEIPPLRDRRKDIPMLVDQFLQRLTAIYQRDIHEVHPVVLEAFMAYAWPGNIRELENLMERAVILESSGVLTAASFPEELFSESASVGALPVTTGGTLAEVRTRALADVELMYLKEQLAVHNGRIGATAKAAGISPRQLHKLMTRYGLKKEDFREGVTGTADSDR